MKARVSILIVVALGTLLMVSVASATNGHGHKPKPKKTNTYHPPIVIPPAYHPPVVTPPNVTAPPIVTAPSAQRNTILFCVQTVNRGWSTVEAEPDAFNAPNGAWYKLFIGKASVLVAGHVLNLTGLEPWEPGNGVVISPNGSCDGRFPNQGVPVIK